MEERKQFIETLKGKNDKLSCECVSTKGGKRNENGFNYLETY